MGNHTHRADASDAIGSARPLVALLFLVLAGGWAAELVRNYNPSRQTTTLPLFGTVLELGDHQRETGSDEQRPRHDRDD